MFFEHEVVIKPSMATKVIVRFIVCVTKVPYFYDYEGKDAKEKQGKCCHLGVLKKYF